MITLRRKRILQLLHSLTTGGAEILADRFGRRFAESYDVHFACLDDLGEIGERLQADGFQVHQLERGEGLDLRCVKRLSKLIRSQSIDLIHAHQYTPFFYALAARGLGTSRPIVFTEHGRFLPDYPRPKRMLFNRLMVRKRDRLVAVGNDVKRALIENEGLAKERVEVVYNGIDVDRFNPGRYPNARQRLLSQLGLTREAIVAVQVARLDYLKDHVTAVRAIAAAAPTNDVHLAIVGEGPERAKIEQAIGECRVSDRVHLLGLRRDVPEILAGADVLLLSSISEGIPLTLIEGMAAGLPIVSTNVGGIPEVVTDQLHGFLSPSQDHQGLGQSVARLANDPGLRKRMGAAGQQEARDRFSEDAMQAAYERIVESVLGVPCPSN